jgi:hypothetical protein
MPSGLRLKFQGGKVEVQTGLGAAKNITAITKASPAVVTSTAHGLTNGDFVQILAVVGMTELNGGWYKVANVAANTFELSGVDSTGYGTYVSGGTAQLGTFGTWCEIKTVTQQDGEAPDIDVTTICSTSKEYEVGLQDGGTLSFTYNHAPKSAIMVRLDALRGVIAPYRITFSAGGGGVWTGLAILKSRSFSGAVDGIWEGSASLRITDTPSVV